MKMLKKGFIWLLSAVLLMGSISMNALALMDTSGNEYVITKKTPSGKTGKVMTVSFTLKNSSGTDYQNVGVGFSQDVDISDDEENLEYGYTFPFEVTDETFTVKTFGSLRNGASKSVSLSAKVRRDITEGYYSVPIKVMGDGNPIADEYINIWISKSAAADTDDTKDGAIDFVLGEGQNTPDGAYPNIMNFTLNLRNDSTTTAQDVTARIVLNKDSAEFPFEINEANYDRRFDRIAGDETVQLPYSFAIRKDTYTGYYPIKMEITYRDSSEGELQKSEATFYVRVKNKDKEDELGDFNANDRTRARLIVDSFETIPSEIYAGDNFELIIRMKNASSEVPASNILFSLESEKVTESAVFATESGSSSIVVNSLGAGEITELRYSLTSKASVDQRAYALTIKEKYDSPEFKNAEESVTVDIFLKQEARLSTSTFEIMPENIEVGTESNIMFGINNTGRVQLYNVNVTFEADSIQTTDAYVGNIEPGKTGNVDVMVSGIAPTADEGKIKAIISYEDENGEVFTVEKELNLFVTEPMDMNFDDSMFGDMEQETEEEKNFLQKHGKIVFPAAAVVIVALITGIVIVKKKKKAALKEDEADDEIS